MDETPIYSFGMLPNVHLVLLPAVSQVSKFLSVRVSLHSAG